MISPVIASKRSWFFALLLILGLSAAASAEDKPLVPRFVAPNASIQKALNAKFPQLIQQDTKLVRVVFIGGAGSDVPPEVAARTQAVAKAFGRAWKGGKFGDYQLVVADGAAPGLPDLAVDAFADEVKDATRLVPRVGYSPMKDEVNHRTSHAPTDRDLIVLTKGVVGSREQGTIERPAYAEREIRMINSDIPTILVSVGGRFGTGQELTIGLDAGKVVGFTRGTGGITDIGHLIVQAAKKAGKKLLAPVVVAPNFAHVREDKLDDVAGRYADELVSRGLASFALGPTEGHTEVGQGSAMKRFFPITFMRLKPEEKTSAKARQGARAKRVTSKALRSAASLAKRGLRRLPSR